MSSNVGLNTPRGSGTSGYVQRNLSLLKPRSTGQGAPYNLDAPRGPKQRKPDQAILTHDRLRDIEVKVLELRDKLEDEGSLSDDAIDEKCDTLRDRLVAEMERNKNKKHGETRKGIKGYQIHELAEAKAVESEKLRRALGLKGGAGGAGADADEHPMARQERRRREQEANRAREEVEREESTVLRDGEGRGDRHDDRHVKRERTRSQSTSLSPSRSRSRSRTRERSP